MQKVQHELKSIVYTLSAGVSVATGKKGLGLILITTSYSNTFVPPSTIYTFEARCSGQSFHLKFFLFIPLILPGSRRAGQVSHMVYFRQLNTPSMVQEIEALQAKINATEDEDEQRALEEDVTGKILWICWCGICADVDQLLPKVVDCIRREESISVSGATLENAEMSRPPAGIRGNLLGNAFINRPR
ncbi:hypothetical protein BKA82DRAFT_3143729 [Pisolithus tinctorius]|nr:hypothetical protein BKA82DRAFT_3143729 [Pisolithus tinctorius]